MPNDPASVPDRSLTQRMDALDRANKVRTRRARFKRDVKAGRASALEAILDPPDWLITAKVIDVVLAMPKVGRTKANKALVFARVSPSKTVGGLSARQRTELVTLLPRPHLRPAR